jgi:hypothetical protein
MQMTGHKTRSVFERYNIVSECDLIEAAKKLNVIQPVHPIIAAEEDGITGDVTTGYDIPANSDPRGHNLGTLSTSHESRLHRSL